MTVYAEVGASLQQIGGSCPNGWIVMQGERPTPEHVAQSDGGWLVVLDLASYDAALVSTYQAEAQSMGYDSWQTCALRAYRPGPFEGEGTAFYDWMEACNVKGYATLAAVTAGEREQPTVTEFLAELPPFVRP